MLRDSGINVRHVTLGDREPWVQMRQALWPYASAAEHDAQAVRFFTGSSREPLAVLVAEGSQGRLVGFAEVSIRAYAEGCDTDSVGYLEGWYVDPGVRGRGVGRALVGVAERWAQSRGCREFASDAEADNDASALAHRALGFTDVGLVRCFRKSLSSEHEAAEQGVEADEAR